MTVSLIRSQLMVLYKIYFDRMLLLMKCVICNSCVRHLFVERWRRWSRRRARPISSSEPVAIELLPGAVRHWTEPRGDDPHLVGSEDARRVATGRTCAFLGQNPRHRTQLHNCRGPVARGRGRRRRNGGVRT